VANVQLGNIAITVSGPGRTDALDLQRIRAPFAGTLTSLRVVVGDHVENGQIIGSIVSQSSEAALRGAQTMVSSATTPTQRSDAARALELARQNLIETSLRAPRAGTVISRGASQGDLLSAGDSIASIAAAGSIAFIARIAQSDLTHLRPGQPAMVSFPGQPTVTDGVVHGLLPADTSGVTVPVRIDLQGAPSAGGVPVQTGLFGTAQITVGEHTAVEVVPMAAVLRDDVSGISRVALVTSANRVHWVTVATGASDGSMVEITSPALSTGQRVIVSGQVGLPEGSRVREAAALRNADSHAP
jgi:RND family efflux transporter MFP subunit